MKNRPQVVAMLLFIFLILAITLTIFFATQQGQDFRSRAQALPVCTGAVTNFTPNDPCPSSITGQSFKSATITCDNGETVTIGAPSGSATDCIDVVNLKLEAEATCKKKCTIQNLPSVMPTYIALTSPTPTIGCGLANLQVRGLCGTPAADIASVKNNYGDYKCLNNTTGTVGDATTCRTYPELSDLAKQACLNNCNQPAISVTPTPLVCREGPVTSHPVPCPESPVPPLDGAATPSPATNVGGLTAAPIAVRPSPTIVPMPKVQGMTFICADRSVENYPTEMSPTTCFTNEELAKRLDELIRGGWKPCKGKWSPACVALSGTPSPSGSPTGPVCATKSKGDCNCDTKIDIIDFECWRKQYNNEVMCQSADFNLDNKCNLNDFETLRQNLFKVGTS